MNLHLYNTSSRPNKVNKSIGDALIVENVKFKEDGALSITAPSVLLNMGEDVTVISQYNYARLPALNRYYFITDISTEGGLIRIDMKCDVLYTFRKDILNSYQYISRSQSKPNYKIVDNLMPIDSNTDYYIERFKLNGTPVAVDDRSCISVILETVGKGGTISG